VKNILRAAKLRSKCELPSSRIKHLLPLAALFIVFSVCIGLVTIPTTIGTVSIEGDNGLWNLYDISFAETTVRLHGFVEYIPNALLTPEEFAEHENESILGSTEGISIVTSRIRIYLPDDGWYTFSRTLSCCSHRLYVNGEQLLDIGTFRESQDIVKSETAQIIFTVLPVDGVVELVLQSTNLMHRWDASPHHWYVGNQFLVTNVRYTDFITSLMIGCLLALFLIFMIMYFFQRGYRANLYFALLCLTLILRSGLLEPFIFSAVFPWFDWHLGFRTMYVTLPIVAWLFVAVVNKLLPWLIHKYQRIMVYFTSFLFVLALLLADIALLSQIMIFCYLSYIITTLYGIFVIVKNFHKVNFEQGILFAGLTLVLFATLYDFNYYTGAQLVPFYINLPYVSIIAYVLFCFCIAIAIFISNMKAIEAAKAAEQQLAVEVAALARINKMKKDLMNTISHEARTPLAVLASYSGLVAMELKKQKGNERIVADLSKIVDVSRRVANLVDSMNKLTLDNMKAEKRIAINLSELIEQTAELYRRIFERSNIEMELAIDADLFVFGCPEELTQVLFNLLQNAKDHTEHGTVTITSMKENSNVIVTIADTGHGIPSDLLPHMFERGVSDSRFGKGIGLSICKEIIDTHNGEILVESEFEGASKGTRITIILPATMGGSQ